MVKTASLNITNTAFVQANAGNDTINVAGASTSSSLRGGRNDWISQASLASSLSPAISLTPFWSPELFPQTLLSTAVPRHLTDDGADSSPSVAPSLMVSFRATLVLTPCTSTVLSATTPLSVVAKALTGSLSRALTSKALSTVTLAVTPFCSTVLLIKPASTALCC